MGHESSLQMEIATLIVSTLHLECEPREIVPTEPLFGNGDGDGLGLDSIDALELAVEIGERYGFEFNGDDERNAQIFASLASLAAHVEASRTR